MRDLKKHGALDYKECLGDDLTKKEVGVIVLSFIDFG
jgi:hypothetical protein